MYAGRPDIVPQAPSTACRILIRDLPDLPLIFDTNNCDDRMNQPEVNESLILYFCRRKPCYEIKSFFYGWANFSNLKQSYIIPSFEVADLKIARPPAGFIEPQNFDKHTFIWSGFVP